MKRVISGAFLFTLLTSACSGGFTKIGDGGGGTASGGSNGNQGGSSAGSGAKAGSNSGGSGTAECESTKDCPQPGAPCEQCSDGSYACPSVECVDGQCVGSFQTCVGTACEADSDCPEVGAPCQQCADGSSACPYSRCEDGTCSSGVEACPETNPCEGKSCGDTCSLCPAGSTCPPVVMYCDAQQQCQFNQPACEGEGCMSDSDCPEVEACPQCPDSAECAEMRCVEGACKFQCSSACSAKGDSCANGEACCGGLECCSGVPVPAGQEYCGEVCPISDRNLKSEFASVDNRQVLEQLVKLPISTWAYKTENGEARHIGPMAQDFMASFGVGSSDRTILQVDADGVAFAAIQALHSRLERLEQRNAELERELSRLSHK